MTLPSSGNTQVVNLPAVPGAFSFLIDLLNDLNIGLDWSIGERCGGIQFAGAFDRSRGGTNGEIGLLSDLAKTLSLPGKPTPGLIGDRQDLAIDCAGGGFEGKGDNGDIRGIRRVKITVRVTRLYPLY